MTYDFEKHCWPAEAFDHTGKGEAVLGKNGMLTVALVSSGSCSLLLEEDAALAHAGSLLVGNGEFPVLSVGGCHLVGIGLRGAAANDLAEGWNTPGVLEGTSCPGAADTLAALVEQLGNRSFPASSLSALAYTLVCNLADSAPAGQSLPPLVAAAMAAIREHYAEVYGVEQLAAELGVSKSHLVRSFSEATGTTPGRLLTQVRVDAARRLLLRPEYTLEVVASLCGFSGANYLCKVFRKETGETPTAYRARMAGTGAPARSEWEDMLFL